jgi:hypothetical protein
MARKRSAEYYRRKRLRQLARNPDRFRAQRRRHYQRHRERILALAKERRQAIIEKYRSDDRLYFARNADRIRRQTRERTRRMRLALAICRELGLDLTGA